MAYPFVNDVTGIAADGLALAREPSLANLDLFGATLIPAVPGAGSALRAIDGALGAGPVKSVVGDVGEVREVRDQAERARDAAEMGFGDITNRAEDFYHGTAGNVAAYDPGRVTETTGFTSGEDLLRQTRLDGEFPAAYFGREVNKPGQPTASGYADEALGRKRDRIFAGDEEGLTPTEDLERKVFEDAGGNVMPVRFRSDRLAELDFKGYGTSAEHWYQSLADGIEDYRKKSGGFDPDAMVIRNVRVEDSASPRTIGSPPREGDQLIDVAVVWDPSKIRSIFARFDRENLTSEQVLVGLAAAGLLVPLSALEREEPFS